MTSVKQITTIILTTSLLLALSACSGSSRGESPVEPGFESIPGITDNLPVAGSIDTYSRSPMAVYEAVIDPHVRTFEVTPVEREVSYHYPLLNLYPNALEVVDYGFTPNFWADIKLTHPLPGSGVDVYDPRVIAIVPAHDGAYFHYPSFGVYGNPKVLLEPDGYTRLFNELAPKIFGNVNPFIAYFKEQPFRVWSSTGETEETKRWEMDYEGFSGDFRFILVVDISTNYPAPPEPIIDNAPEPIEIFAEVGEGLSNYGGTAPVEVRLKHWKDIEDVGGVLVEAPELFHDVAPIQYYSYSPYYKSSIFRGSVPNIKLAPQGMHSLMVKSWDTETGLEMYNEASAVVEFIPRDGNLIWAKRAGDTGNDRSYAITTLSDDSTVTTGSFVGTATFGEGEPNEATLTSAGYADAFVARYNPDGALVWAIPAAIGPRSIHAYGITTLSDDSVVVTGQFRDTATFGEGELNETTLITTGGSNIFVARYNPDGALVWAKKAGGYRSSYDFARGYAITALSDNSVITTGSFTGTMTFERESSDDITLTAFIDAPGGVDSDIFIARYMPDGTVAWAKSTGGTDFDRGYATTTLSDDSTVATGSFRESITFGKGEPNETTFTSAGEEDIFIARYNPNGTLEWAKRAGGPKWATGYAITTLSDDSTVVTGRFYETTTFGEGEPNEVTLFAYSADMFVARYNPDGTIAWVKRAGGSRPDIGYGITTLSDDSTVITGAFEVEVTFGEGQPNETTLTAASSVFNPDIFVARYNPDGTFAWAKRAGWQYKDQGRGITSLSDDSTVATGWFYRRIIFGEGEPYETELRGAHHSADNIFIARFEP